MKSFSCGVHTLLAFFLHQPKMLGQNSISLKIFFVIHKIKLSNDIKSIYGGML